jgi:hypothetical protein
MDLVTVCGLFYAYSFRISSRRATFQKGINIGLPKSKEFAARFEAAQAATTHHSFQIAARAL